MKKLFPLLIAIGCGIVAVVLLVGYLQRREDQMVLKLSKLKEDLKTSLEQEEKNKVMVVVVTKDIGANTPLTANDVSARAMPRKYVSAASIPADKWGDVVGKITVIPLSKGEPVLKTKLKTSEKTSRRSGQITPEGKRAINILVDNATGIVELIKVGDFVDVQAWIAMPPEISMGRRVKKKKGTNEESLIPIFQGVEVLKVQPASGKITVPVTIALLPEEANLISFVQEKGKIKLVLRSAGDDDLEPLYPADWNTLYQHLTGKERKSVNKEPSPVVEIYRGADKGFIPLAEGEK